MIATLETCHTMMRAGPQSLAEATFQHAFGRDLDEAAAWVARFQATRARADINAAWEVYKSVFGRLSERNRAMSKLDLHLVSPTLLAARDLDLAVPGTYRPNVPFVRIQAFAPSMTVIVSKQRPRKLSLYADDGTQVGQHCQNGCTDTLD